MGLNDLTIEGYRYNDVRLTAVVGPEHEGKEGARLDPLALREFGLNGGEIHISLPESNRTADDPGVWYATKCVVDSESLAQGGTGPNHRIGELLIKQMGADDQEMLQVCLELEELDTSHLVDRLVSETLSLHAATFGPGPHVSKPKHRSPG